MKRFLRFILPALAFLSCSHLQKLDGNYFSDKQDCLSFGEKTGFIETFEKGVLADLFIKQKRNKVKFKTRRVASNGIFKKRWHKYYFKVIERDVDGVMVSPSSKLSKEYFDHRDSLLFKPKYAYVDRTINFEKIVYHASQCGWYCPDLHMKLDKGGNITLTNNGNGLTDTVKNKNYRGQLSPQELERLVRILSYSQLNTVKWKDDSLVSDVRLITMIVYFNGKRLYLKSRTLPIVSWELSNYLYRLLNHKSLTRENETFEYEQ